MAVEWPERAPQLAERSDLTLEFLIPSSGGRRVTVTARSGVGIEALKSIRHGVFNNET
jgi:tRNA A37 threonylcarbamoyladenosine biosynthesis protein TsaE